MEGLDNDDGEVEWGTQVMDLCGRLKMRVVLRGLR